MVWVRLVDGGEDVVLGYAQADQLPANVARRYGALVSGLVQHGLELGLRNVGDEGRAVCFKVGLGAVDVVEVIDVCNVISKQRIAVPEPMVSPRS